MKNKTHRCPMNNCDTVLEIDIDGDIEGGLECVQCEETVCEDCCCPFSDTCLDCIAADEMAHEMSHAEQKWELATGR